jgi:LacI family transcriptional regulator
MKYSSITIIDIAKALGISKSTVSRALKDSHDISSSTKKKIQDYARQHNYEPNPIARGLQSRQTYTIAVVVPELKNNFFAQAIEGIDSVVNDKGYQTLIAQTYETLAREMESTRHLASRSIDGLIISVSAETSDYEHLRQLHKKGLPIVFFDRVPEDFDTHKVVNDNCKGAFMATELLLKKGYKRILHVAHSASLSITQDRTRGYKQALEKYGIPFSEKLVYHCEHGAMDELEVEMGIIKSLKSKPKPDAVFSSGDRITTICYNILRRQGYKIPEDIAFVGFSNNTMMDLFHPSISFIRQPAYEMGRAAAELVLRLIESKKPTKIFEKRILQPLVVSRSSQ